MPKILNWEESLYDLKQSISIDLDHLLRKEEKPVSPVQEMLFRSFASMVVEEDDSTLLSRCYRLDPKARKIIIDLIYQRLICYNLKLTAVDNILENYHINYYGSPSDITSSNLKIGFDRLKYILISKTDDFEVKLAKLAQVIYQESYGVSIVDEFIYQPAFADGTKIEEVACFGPDAFWMKISGVELKLDKVEVPKRNLKPVVEHLSTCAANFTLNSHNCKVSTDSLNNDRVSLTGDTYSKYYEFNIRRAYPKLLTREMLIKSRSTTVGLEKFYDDVMKQFPVLAIVADQAAGKSSLLRRLAERYPANTVIGTIESAYELELSQIRHLIVKQLKAGKISSEEALEDSLRFALSIMIYGEARSGIELSTSIQAAQRSTKGSLATGHGADIKTWFRSMVQVLIRDGIFTSEASAMYNLVQCYDVVVIPAVDNVGDGASGLRYIDSIWEIPSVRESEIESFEPILLWQADDNFVPRQLNGISDELYEKWRKRSSDKKALDRLRRLSYND